MSLPGISRLSRRAVLLWAPTAALVGCGSESPLPKVAAPADVLAMEKAMGRRVNQDRAGKGLPPLGYDEALADVARFHADDMQRNKFFAHESPSSGALDDRLARAGYLAAIARENLAEALDVDSAEDGLLKSPGHYANIMSADVTHIGVGIVRGGVADPRNFLFVQVFARPVEKESPSDTKAKVLGKIAAARSKKGLPTVGEIGALGDIADDLIGDMPDDIAPSSLERLGKDAVQRLAKAKTELTGVTVSGARILGSSEYEPPNAALSPGAKGFGIAVAPAKDEKGHPALKVLLLIGQ
jgi:uncharacterized protein YkwD